MNITWDAAKYTDDFSFVHRYGEGVIELLDFSTPMRCLDLGCGNGALTAQLAARGANVIGLDMSAELLTVARTQHADLRFEQGDATSFILSAPVDAVFSNAVFHWIDAARQPDMLRCVFRALKPSGQFVFEMGGQGNNALIHAALASCFGRHGLVYSMPFYFPTIGQYAALLEQVGFRVTFATLFDRPTPLKGEDGLYDWIRMFVKTPFVGMTEDVQEAVIREAVAELEPLLHREDAWYADYVRLRMKAIKP